MNATATAAMSAAIQERLPAPPAQGQRSPDQSRAIESLQAALLDLRRRCPTLPVLSIHWMHVKHPIHAVQEQLMAQAQEERPCPLPRYGALLGGFVLCLLYAGYLTARMAQMRWCLRRSLAALRRERFAVAAKTWRMSAARSADGRDFYYGDLQQRLADRGVRMLLICGDAQGNGWLRFARSHISAERGIWQVPEWCLVPLLAPWIFAWQQLRSARRLRRIAAREIRPFQRRVASYASRACVSRQIMPVGLNAWMAQAVVRRWRPRAFLALYEGHGWEQCLWRGVQAADGACHTVGYQHTILLRHNRALLGEPLADDPHMRPDLVLCLGPRTRAMLQPSHARASLLSFGTFRAAPEPSAAVSPAPQRRTVLVLPEGYVGESALLFNAALAAAQALPDHRFILRLHPILPFAQVRPHLSEDPAGLANVAVSTGGPIEQDFARASVVLYRGSSSALYAVAYGLKPVYLHDASLHAIDPLFELDDGWRERAERGGDLAAVLGRYAVTEPAAAMHRWRAAADYVTNYAVPVSDASVSRWLTALGLAQEALA